eukprot:8637502-Pyramimonas_sp.AAC.1
MDVLANDVMAPAFGGCSGVNGGRSSASQPELAFKWSLKTGSVGKCGPDDRRRQAVFRYIMRWVMRECSSVEGAGRAVLALRCGGRFQGGVAMQ